MESANPGGTEAEDCEARDLYSICKQLEGVWSHSAEGEVIISHSCSGFQNVKDPHVIVDDSQEATTEMISVSRFCPSPGNLAYKTFTGTFDGDTVTWSTGARWTKLSVGLPPARPSISALASQDFQMENLPTFKRDVRLMVDMGVDRHKAQWALKTKAGNLEPAAELATSPEAEEEFAKYQADLNQKKQEEADEETYEYMKRMTLTAAAGAGAVAVGVGAAAATTAAAIVVSGAVAGTAIWASSSTEEAEEKLTGADANSTSGPRLHLPEPVLAREESMAILSQWVGPKRTSFAALKEYEKAVGQICVPHEMMKCSRLGGRLWYLEDVMLAQRGTIPPMATIAIAIIAKAFSLPSTDLALQHSVDMGCLAEGNLFDGALQYYSGLTWERPYLAQTLCWLCESEDASSLQVILGMMRQGADWCKARKTYIFCEIMERFPVPRDDGANLEDSESPEKSLLESMRHEVWDVTAQLVDSTKDLAFKTTFLEPTKMCFRGRGEFVREDLVEVHGANVYLAVLSSTLGVQLNRRPYLNDMVVGCVDFLYYDPNPLAWKEEHFGADWQSVRELRQAAAARELEPDDTPVQVGLFEFFGIVGSTLGYSSFVFSGARVKDVANAAVDPEGDADLRLHMAKYLERYTYWFSEDFIVPRIVMRLIGDDRCLKALQGLMDDLLLKQPSLAGDEDESDVRYWLWDTAELPAVFRKERARRLLRHAGVLCAEDGDAEASTGACVQTSPASSSRRRATCSSYTSLVE